MSVKRKNDKEVVKRLYRGEKAIRNFVAGNSIMINCLDFIQTILKNEKYKEKQGQRIFLVGKLSFKRIA